MRRTALALLCAVCVLSAGCVGDTPASTNSATDAPTTDSRQSDPTTTGPDTITDSDPTTTRLTPDSMIPDDILHVNGGSGETRAVSVAVFDLDDGTLVRTVNRTLEPDAEFDVAREEPGAKHRRVVVRVDGTIVFDRTVFTAEHYVLTVESATNVAVGKAVA